MSNPNCAKCGLPESEHHPFKAAEIPPSCVCITAEWCGVNFTRGEKRSVICGEFKLGHAPFCVCGHREACHTKGAGS